MLLRTLTLPNCAGGAAALPRARRSTCCPAAPTRRWTVCQGHGLRDRPSGHSTRRVRAPVLCRDAKERDSSKDTSPPGPSNENAHEPEGVLARLWLWHQSLPGEQQVYVAVLALLVLLLLPKLATFALLVVERLLMASLLATEEALFLLLGRLGVLVGVAGVIALTLWGVYIFAIKRQRT